VAVARALANDPPLILADEPTGNLDSKSGQEVMAMMSELARERDKAVIIVTHDNRIMSIADRVLWLEDGLLSEQEPEDYRTG
jgi:putative ABC transport system ATP-binding protein